MAASDKTIAIVQSSYIPWKGYFDLIALADEFILLDDVQYSPGSWRNRNRIKTPAGSTWVTIPVRRDQLLQKRIDEMEVADSRWAQRHWKSIRQSYARAEHFDHARGVLEQLFVEAASEANLSLINQRFIVAICEVLGIETPVRRSTDYAVSGESTTRVVNLCRAANATRYLSGPSARDYLDQSAFEQAGIELVWMSYDDYPEYPQLHPPFEHAVTVLDLILNTGPDAGEYMKGMTTPLTARR